MGTPPGRLPVQVGAHPSLKIYDRSMANVRQTTQSRADTVFPALLRYWRHQRGMTQLDLSLTAGVSARHISFLETGRSQPSIEMVLLLAEMLDVPLRDRNELLRGAGYSPHYPEEDLTDLLNGPLGVALDTMLEHHDPFPMLVFDRLYNVVRVNDGGSLLLAFGGVTDLTEANLATMVFEQTARRLVVDWPELARTVLRRIQREVLQRPNDEELAVLLADLLDGDIPDDWRSPDLLSSSQPVVNFQAKLADGSALSFLTTITAFNAPSSVTLDELRIESYVPTDEATRAFFGE